MERYDLDSDTTNDDTEIQYQSSDYDSIEEDDVVDDEDDDY